MLDIRKEVKERTEGIMLLNGDVMKEVNESGYQYLGVLEGADINGKEMREKVSYEYFRRVKLARSKLYGGNLIKGVNVWAVSVARYTSEILE